MTMNPEIKDLWTERLRSGEIPQGEQYLRMGDKYCCLGVLCELAGEAGIIEPRPMEGVYDEDGNFIPAPDSRWDYGQPDDAETLPGTVQDWAGLRAAGSLGENPLVRVPDEILPRLGTARSLISSAGIPDQVSLAQLNDAGVPFTVIADIIDATL